MNKTFIRFEYKGLEVIAFEVNDYEACIWVKGQSGPARFRLPSNIQKLNDYVLKQALNAITDFGVNRELVH